MTPELTALALAALVQVAQMSLYSMTAIRQVGVETAASARDSMPPLTGAAGRLQRAMNNHFEGLILFAIAVMVVTLSQSASAVTGYCAYAYLVARIAYIPAYVFGWSPLRTVIWAVGYGATVVMIVTALFSGG